MQRHRRLVGPFPVAENILAMMFNEDGDVWADSSDTKQIIAVVAPRYPSEELTKLIAELDALLASNFSDEEIDSYLDHIGVRIGFGGLSAANWLRRVRTQLNEFIVARK